MSMPPPPADAKKVAAARLVVQNGLGFEGWIDRLIKASDTKARIVVATRGIKPLKAPADTATATATAMHGEIDPHAWQIHRQREDLRRQHPRRADRRRSRPAREAYAANAAAYHRQARRARQGGARRASQKSRRSGARSSPPTSLRLFRRGLRHAFIAPQGVSTEAEPSARDVARIIRQIRPEKIPAVFLENITDPRLIERIAKETGAKTRRHALFRRAFAGPTGRAGTYIDMMRHNIRELTGRAGRMTPSGQARCRARARPACIHGEQR